MFIKATLALFYFLLLNYAIYRFRILQFRIFQPWVSLLLFNVKIIAGVLIWAIYTFYYQDKKQNDVHKFYNDAVALHEIRKDNPDAFWRLMLGKEVRPEEAGTLQNWDRHFDEAPVNENRTIIRVQALLMFFSYRTYLIHIFFMCLLSYLGLKLLTEAVFRTALPEASVFAWAALMLPSIQFWTSGVMKEPLLMLGIGFFVHGLTTMENCSYMWKNILFVATGTALILSSKFFVLACFLPAAIAFLLFPKKNNVLFIAAKYLSVVVLFLIIALNIQQLFPSLDLPQMLVNKQQHSIKEAEYHAAGSRINIPELRTDSWSILRAAPQGVWNTLARPFLWESQNPMMLASAIENLLVMVLLIIAMMFFSFKDFSRYNLVGFLLFSSLAYFALIGMATPVLVNLVRYKTPVLLLLLYAAFIGVKTERWKGIVERIVTKEKWN